MAVGRAPAADRDEREQTGVAAGERADRSRRIGAEVRDRYVGAAPDVCEVDVADRRRRQPEGARGVEHALARKRHRHVPGVHAIRVGDETCRHRHRQQARTRRERLGRIVLGRRNEWRDRVAAGQ